MGSISDYLENKWLDHLCGTAYTQPATVYLALCTADPTDAGTGASMNECADSGSYQRTAISFGTAASRVITQNAQVTFPQATGSWSTVTHWSIVDTQTHGAGNMLAHGAFGTGKAIVSGNTPSVASGQVNVTVSAGEVSDYAANALLDKTFRNQTFAAPTTYVAFCTATVSDSDTGSTITEVSGGSYAREVVNLNGGASPTWDLAASGTLDNTHQIDFTEATASWGTVVAVAICDAATLGNLLLYDNTMADQAVDSGDTAYFGAGDLDISLS